MTKRILMVEDEPIVSKFLCDLLGHVGYEVLLAEDGEQAVVMTKAEQPDLVLMDIHLPVMDGLAATREIKGNPATRKIHVVALTGMTFAEDHSRIYAAGCDGFITKPVHVKTLLDKIAGYLAEDRSAAS